ncbi:MAG: helix-turn-helix domain-containing protein, partial [Roseburia sp.]|nr:helix-turn-helix domain-containing protein [Roseburia sp.]
MAETVFAERFLEAMKKNGMKQVDLLKAAESAGIKLGKSQISQYVNGKAVPRENIAQFLAKTLQVEKD